MKNLTIWARVFREWLQHPARVLLVVGSLAFVAVLLDGTLFRLWSLDRDHDRLVARIESLRLSIRDKEKRLAESNRPEFIERQAREQLDLVRDGDLVFIFSDSDSGQEDGENSVADNIKASDASVRASR